MEGYKAQLLPSSIFIIAAILFVIAVLTPSAQGQFPRVCANNATKPNATCCPNDEEYQLPCGGPTRGQCLPLDDVHERFRPQNPKHMHDDRLNWPKAFFTNICHCIGNFAGYACQECKFGYHGDECEQRRIQKRRNFLSLSKEEQQRFIGLLLKAKTSLSEYVALKADKHDPPENLTFVNVTVYDFFIYIHYYSARSTYIRNNGTSPPCEDNQNHWDFSHEGAGFPTFHRLLIMLWEREFQKLADDDTFMFPYWDWVDNGHECAVCTNELMGAINRTDPHGYLDKKSVFAAWYTMCQIEQPKKNDTKNTDSPCRFCDPSKHYKGLVRRPNKKRTLPDFMEIEKILNLQQYDIDPYDETAEDTSFRNCFEGNCPIGKDKYGIHNKVHGWFNGTLSGVTTSTNDPLFILHHAMIDKLFERWLRMHKPHVTQFPEFGAPIGHNRYAVMVPMFPRHFHAWYFVDSRTLGYDYDNFDYGGRVRRHPETYLGYYPEYESLALLSACVVLPGVVFLAVFVHLIFTRNPQKHMLYRNLTQTEISHPEVKPFFDDLSSESELDLSTDSLLREKKSIVNNNIMNHSNGSAQK